MADAIIAYFCKRSPSASWDLKLMEKATPSWHWDSNSHFCEPANPSANWDLKFMKKSNSRLTLGLKFAFLRAPVSDKANPSSSWDLKLMYSGGGSGRH